MEHESIEFDVAIVGAGPSGLSAAIRLKQLAQIHQQNISVCIIEKGAEVGAHILSGAVIEPTSLDELLPEWRNSETPLQTKATKDKFLFLTRNHGFKLPIPPILHNQGNYIISLGQLCRFLAKEAEKLGVEIFPGFPGNEILYNEKDEVIGVATKDMGINKAGEQTVNYQPGIHIHAKYTLLAEGCRGSLTKQLIHKFQLAKNCDPQTYGIGIKELWEVDNAHHKPGTVIHTIGWPLDRKIYGGSFLYHLDNQKISVGFIMGLDYQNPYCSPYDVLQQFKTHPKIKPYFEKGKRIAYGARAIVEGGFQSLPELEVPGALIIGDAGGFLNVFKIKGTHTAMKSGMVAAETVFEGLRCHPEEHRVGWAKLSAAKRAHRPLHGGHAQQSCALPTLRYRDNLKKTWLWKELYNVRNIRPAFKYGQWFGLIYAAVVGFIFRGRCIEPWTFQNHADYKQLKLAKNCQPYNYLPPDGKLTFDKLSSLYTSNTNHQEDQPCFIELKKPELAINVNWNLYRSPEERYCPANVYEILNDAEQKPYLQINYQNCLHCKTCDIKDPKQNINWAPPEGGGGPNYEEM